MKHFFAEHPCAQPTQSNPCETASLSTSPCLAHLALTLLVQAPGLRGRAASAGSRDALFRVHQSFQLILMRHNDTHSRIGADDLSLYP